MPVSPESLRWCVAGIQGQDPRGTPVPLTPELRMMLAGLVTVPTPEPDPGPGERVGTSGFNFPTDAEGWPIFPVRGEPVRVSKGGDLGAAVKRLTPGGCLELECGAGWSYLPVLPEGTVVRSFGSGPQPNLRRTVQTGVKRIVLSDLAFVTDKQSGGGVRGMKYEGLFIDGCTISGHDFGMTGELGGEDFFVHRSVIANNRPSKHYSSGIYIDRTKRLGFVENLWDTNGWQPGKIKANEHNHHCYPAADNDGLIATGNMFYNAASHGLQARPGGIVEDNYFLNNAIHLSYGLVNGEGVLYKGGVTGRVFRNVFEGGRDINGGTSPGPRGYAMEAANIRSAEFTGNYFVNSRYGRGAIILLKCRGKNQGDDVGIKSLTIADNVTANWGRFMENQSHADFVDRNNRATAKIVTFSDYVMMLGMDLTAWMSRAKLNRRGNWDARFTGGAASRWVRANAA